MSNQQRPDRADGSQAGPGEQIRPKDGSEESDLDNLRGGADPSGGQSSEVPRDNSRAGPFGPDSSRPDGSPTAEGSRDTTPLSTPSEESADARPTEDELRKAGREA